MQRRSAFTLLEILVTVFIFILVFGFSLLYTQLGALRADLKTQADILQTHLREAQSNATSGKESGSGIHFEEGSYVLFSGTVYDPMSTSNLEVDLPDTLTLGSLVLNGGGSEMIFDAPLGDTDEYGTLVLSSSRTSQALTFTISALGQVSYDE